MATPSTATTSKMSIVIQSQLQQGRTVRLLTGDNIDRAAIDDLMALLPRPTTTSNSSMSR
ncbi:hypothetical protein HGG76_23680 [Ochrobactrum tritici]|uniref:Uncharacterized protein n=1 Tax=Brucella tritici TaxID=94626 RepID=A0A7X6JBF2_9HYPH|nr:hypothetical protein [Brucella tritici]